MSVIQSYKFELKQGWPPDGEPGFFFGFDADFRPSIIRWFAAGEWSRDAGWHGIRLDEYLFGVRPEVFIRGEGTKDRVTQWSPAPACLPKQLLKDE